MVAGSNPAIPTSLYVTLITTNIFESGRLVVACFSGVVTMPEIEDYFFWLVDQHGGEIGDQFSQLIYSSELEKIDIQLKDLQRISHLIMPRSVASEVILSLHLLVTDLKIYWMAKLHKTLSKNSGINTRIFRDTDEAFDWLSFDNPLIN